MSSYTSDKLEYLKETKNLIKASIKAKGQTVKDTDTFRSYAKKIDAISTGSNPVLSTLNVTENGEYKAPAGIDGYNTVNVNVPDIPAVIHPLSITENGTYTAPANVDGYNPIVVEVPSEEPVLQDKEITENGSYSADAGFDGLGTVTVNIPDPTKTVILAEQEISGFAYVENSGLSLYMLPTLSPAPFILNDGETYYVRWDGTEYECVASSVEGVVLVGNGGILGLPSTGEPFAALYDPTRNALDVVTSQEGESHTVGIWQKVSQEIKLQDKTITENGEYTADEGFDGLGKVTVDVAGSGSDDVRYVTFMSYDGLVEYGKKAVAVGDDCADPIARGIFAKPTRESDAQYNYTFYGWATTPNGGAVSGWNKAITEDKTVYANFTSTVRYYTITYYDDDGTTVLKTESLAYGAMPVYLPSKEGFGFSGWNPELATVTSNADYKAVWTEVISFENCSWSDIARISESGKASEHFNIGDEKPFTFSFNGVTYTTNARIIDFNHDDLSDDSGKAGISFAITDNVVPMIQGSDSDYIPIVGTDGKTYQTAYGGGWPNYFLRTKLNQEVFSSLDNELQTAIKSVKKRCYCVETYPVDKISEDKLWILSVSEIGASRADANFLTDANDGTQYPGFNRNDSRYIHSSNSYSPYRLRSGFGSNRDYAHTYRTSNKTLSASHAITQPTYLVFGFCI